MNMEDFVPAYQAGIRTQAEKVRLMPMQKPGQSKQNYQTPADFIEAVKARLHIPAFGWDLAADGQNKQALYYYDEVDNSLSKDWNHLAPNYQPIHKWLWLNPPFSDIGPWVEKATLESAKGAHIAMLVPASVGANWWRHYVEHSSYQLFLNGRIQFVGCKDLYPKDCALVLYTPFIRSGNATWNWKGRR